MPVANPAEPRLWLLALVLFGLGDLATTSAGLGVGAVEINPLPRQLIGRHGLSGMVALKLLTLGGCLALWSVVPRPHRVGIPIGLSLLGALVNTWNVTVLVIALLS